MTTCTSIYEVFRRIFQSEGMNPNRLSNDEVKAKVVNDLDTTITNRLSQTDSPSDFDILVRLSVLIIVLTINSANLLALQLELSCYSSYGRRH
jgi:hypothetical protein